MLLNLHVTRVTWCMSKVFKLDHFVAPGHSYLGASPEEVNLAPTARLLRAFHAFTRFNSEAGIVRAVVGKVAQCSGARCLMHSFSVHLYIPGVCVSKRCACSCSCSCRVLYSHVGMERPQHLRPTSVSQHAGRVHTKKM